MTEKPKRRGDRNDVRTPDRVGQAVTLSYTGSQRGYVPGKSSSGYPEGGNPQPGGNASYPYRAADGRQYRQGPAQPPYPGPVNSQGPSQNGARKYQTGSYGTVNGLRGYVAVPEETEKPQRKRRIFPLVAAFLTLLAVGAGGTFAALQYSRTKQIAEKVRPYDQLFVPGVYVDGIQLGGMTPEQAMNSVQSQIRQRNDAWSVSLNYQGELLATINADMLGMSVDLGEVMNNAWIQGHQGADEQRYSDMLALEENPYYGYTATPSGDTSVIDSLMKRIKDGIDTPAVNATAVFDPTAAYPFVYTEEVYGKSLDTGPLIEQLYHMVSTMQSGRIEITPDTIAPRITKADLMKHYMLRSSVYTPISTSSTEERNNNIRRSFELINGYVVDAGKSFSFNSVVGQRTEENGFFPAVEYAYGEHVMGIGGGVCQASSTLYQAAVCAGLQIVKREPHSDAVNYTEYGKDATVYWMGKRKIDLVFKNTTESPVYLIATVQEDPSNKRRKIAKVSIYGEDMGDTRYEIVSEVIEELEPPADPEYVKDKDGTYVTYTDQEKSVSKAKPGYVVRSYRVEYSGNTVVSQKELYTDTYKPKAERIYVGVKKRESN